MTTKQGTLWGLVAGILGTLLVFAMIGLIVVYTGAYNVAASQGHSPLARWTLDTTMENSIRNRAAGLEPPEFTTADLREGASEYVEYCVHCHGAPGVEPAEWASGMLPNPPDLAHAAEEWTLPEIYWIVEHGIKMTGMPPFGDGHDERTIWNIAHFVEQLPAMTPERYRALGGPEAANHTH